jgi:hypothetical protein
MANFELKFLDSRKKMFITVNATPKGNYEFFEDYIKINLGEFDGQELWINLDKSTAIKFAKTLRTEINKITEREVSNE